MLGSLFVGRWIAQFMPGASPLAVWVWLTAPAVLFVAVAIASVVDPLTIMRDR